MHIEEYDPAAATDLQRFFKIEATWRSLQGEDGELVEGIYLEFFPLQMFGYWDIFSNQLVFDLESLGVPSKTQNTCNFSKHFPTL